MASVGGLIDIPVWLMLLAFITILYYMFATSTFGTWKRLGVVGPVPTPIFGHVHKIFDPVKGVRRVVNEWIEQYGKTFGVYYFRKPLLVVTDIELLKLVFVKDFNHYTNRWFAGEGRLQQPIIKKGLFFEDGMDWKRIRRIASPTFSSGKLKLLMHHINKTGKHLGEKMVFNAQNEKLAAAHTVFGAYSLDVIGGTAFGLDINSQDNYEIPFIKHAKSIMTFGKRVEIMFTCYGFFPITATILHKLGYGLFNKNDVEYFKGILKQLIDERRIAPNAFEHADFLQLMLNAEEDQSTESLQGAQKLSSDEITAQAILFIIAGYGTTSSLLQFLFYELGRHPDIQEKIVQEINEHIGEKDDPSYEDCQNLKYLEAAINEALRVYPPVHMLTRDVLQEVKLADFTIPANAGILIPIANIMKNPEYFEDPDCFMPERFLTEKRAASMISFLPFGFGPRQCIGMRLAMLQIKVAVIHMLKQVEVVQSLPAELIIEDNLGVLEPKVPIQLRMKVR